MCTQRVCNNKCSRSQTPNIPSFRDNHHSTNKAHSSPQLMLLCLRMTYRHSLSNSISLPNSHNQIYPNTRSNRHPSGSRLNHTWNLIRSQNCNQHPLVPRYRQKKLTQKQRSPKISFSLVFFSQLRIHSPKPTRSYQRHCQIQNPSYRKKASIPNVPD